MRQSLILTGKTNQVHWRSLARGESSRILRRIKRSVLEIGDYARAALGRLNLQVEVEKVSCSQAQEPLLVKTEEKCSEVGVDAKPGGKMSKVVIGWKVDK